MQSEEVRRLPKSLASLTFACIKMAGGEKKARVAILKIAALAESFAG